MRFTILLEMLGTIFLMSHLLNPEQTKIVQRKYNTVTPSCENLYVISANTEYEHEQNWSDSCVEKVAGLWCLVGL